jgi:hypothetical protein
VAGLSKYWRFVINILLIIDKEILNIQIGTCSWYVFSKWLVSIFSKWLVGVWSERKLVGG